MYEQKFTEKSVLGRANSRYKSPNIGVCPGCMKKLQRGRVAGEE